MSRRARLGEIAWSTSKPIAWISFGLSVLWIPLVLSSMMTSLAAVGGLALIVLLSVWQFQLLGRAEEIWEAGDTQLALAVRCSQLTLLLAALGLLFALA